MALEHLSSSEFDLEGEWQKQAERLATLFAKELGLSKEEYIASLPKFGPQSEAFRGRFDIPVIVETRIQLRKMLELAGIHRYSLNSKYVKDWEDGEFSTPSQPYVAWMQDGSRHSGKSIRSVRNSLAPYERGGTVYEGIALYLRDPKILTHRLIKFPGSQYGGSPENAPHLQLWGGDPLLSWLWVGHVGPDSGPASCPVSCGRS